MGRSFHSLHGFYLFLSIHAFQGAPAHTRTREACTPPIPKPGVTSPAKRMEPTMTDDQRKLDTWALMVFTLARGGRKSPKTAPVSRAQRAKWRKAAKAKRTLVETG